MKRSYLIVGLLALIPACRWKMKPTFPANHIVDGLVQMCAKDYKMPVEARHEEKTLQMFVQRAGLFTGQTYDLQGMSKSAEDTMEHSLLCATRIALSTDASLDFIEVKIADVLTGATVTLWRYVPDIRDSMYERIGDTEYFSRLVIEIDTDKANVGPHHGANSLHWDKPITMSEFLAKQIILRARRDGGEALQAHADLSQPATLGVIIDNWSALQEEGPDRAAKMADVVHRAAQTVLKGYRFQGFHGLTLRDSQGVALNSWPL